MKKLVLSVLVALVFNSCATKVAGLSKSESFNYQNIKKERMIIGGVVHSTEPISYKEMISFSNLLKNKIMEEREGFKVTSAGVIGKRLGKEKYKAVLSEFEMDSEFSNSSTGLFKQKLKGRRYIVFARIESDNIEETRNDRENTDSDGNDTGSSTITAQVSRELTVNFKVLDLKDNNTAWSGTVSKKSLNEQKYKKRTQSGLVSLIKAFKGTEDKNMDKAYPFPKPPSLKKVLTNVFAGFAENLPEED